MFTSTSGQR